jgi:hypothetical protein
VFHITKKVGFFPERPERGPTSARLNGDVKKRLSSGLLEMRSFRAQRCKLLLGMELLCFLEERIFGFYVIGIRDTAIDRTDCSTLFPLKVSNTLGALVRSDVIEIV